MQHKPPIQLARLAVRSRICPTCYQRPQGSETLALTNARVCEPGCTIFLNLERLLAAIDQGSLPDAPDAVMRKVVCPTCQVSSSAGDYCSEGVMRTCPLSRYGGQVLELLEDLAAIMCEDHQRGPPGPPN